MKRTVSAGVGLALLAVGFLLFSILNNLMFSGVRLDLTENRLYTLSDGSREIVAQIDEPINLYFFFSQSTSKDLTSLRAYARQVEELLEEYRAASGGKINLQVIDPEPFSEDEDLAASFGLQSIPVNNAGEELYFGLAGTNALDDQATIPFIQPDKEAFLEYDISKLIQGLLSVEKPVVGIMSTIKIMGDVNMQTFQSTPAWMIVEQLQQLFEVETLEVSATEIPERLDLVVLVHPKDLSDDTLFALDQFVLGGGRMLVFVDPLAEQDRPAAPNPMMGPQGSTPSDLKRLFDAWGITLKEGVILADAQSALAVGGQDGQPVRHLAIVGLGPDNFSTEDVTISSLESINLATSGIFDISDAATTTITPLIESSAYAQPIDAFRLQFLSDPSELQKDFAPTGEVYPLAVRLEGSAKSAFPDREGTEGFIAETAALNVIAVADTDLLTDQMWVQVQNFFGQRIASPWAGNGDFVINAVDNLVGSNELISVRSRGRYARPFTVVQDLRREAEARYLESANELQARLTETESRLSELQSSQSESGMLSLSPEQETALKQFQEQKLVIRKQLRDVRRQLDKDIEQLGSTLKFLNIALIPILLTLMLLMLNYLRLRGEAKS